MSFSSFLMISLELSLYSIMSSANSDNFTSPFLIRIPFVYFSHLIDVAGTSFTTLKYVPSTGFPGGSDSKESACNAGDPGSIPELERFSGEGNGYPLQYSCLENPMSSLVGYSPWHCRVGHDWATNTNTLCSLYTHIIESFYHESMLNFIKSFSSIFEMIIWFLFFVNMVYHVD